MNYQPRTGLYNISKDIPIRCYESSIRIKVYHEQVHVNIQLHYNKKDFNSLFESNSSSPNYKIGLVFPESDAGLPNDTTIYLGNEYLKTYQKIMSRSASCERVIKPLQINDFWRLENSLDMNPKEGLIYRAEDSCHNDLDSTSMNSDEETIQMLIADFEQIHCILGSLFEKNDEQRDDITLDINYSTLLLEEEEQSKEYSVAVIPFSIVPRIPDAFIFEIKMNRFIKNIWSPSHRVHVDQIGKTAVVRNRSRSSSAYALVLCIELMNDEEQIDAQIRHRSRIRNKNVNEALKQIRNESMIDWKAAFALITVIISFIIAAIAHMT
eukprot:gb/GECH01000383.1/.p1 GENE.gb/GECH01000383.1/~~gb/GECH01000383.1/.p1  ORF type:complete len:324 (+),score=72.04 gb/GECH01000383.1/:1-972(+)